MKKLLYFFSICIISCIISSSAVFAADWNGEPPYKDIPAGSFIAHCEPPEAAYYGFPMSGSFSSDSHTVYFSSEDLYNGQGDVYYFPFTFSIGSAPNVSVTNCPLTSGYYFYTFNGVEYKIFYSRGYISLKKGYDISVNGNTESLQILVDSAPTYVDHVINSLDDYKAIANYFLFGVGDIDYVPPVQDIPDNNLDIVGLLGSVSDVYTDNGSFGSNLRNAWNSFIQGLFSLLPDGLGDTISAFNGGNNLFASQLGNVRTTIPGIQLIWDSPVIHHSSSDENITYTFWIDGSATADLAIYGQNYHAAVTFHKLQLRSSYIFYNPSLIYYYSSNQDYQVVLDYILSNTHFSDAGSTVSDQTVLNTTISRIYIQASKVDDNGDNHFGAVSYVDFSSGFPVVYEGVTDSIDDIESSDSDNGTTNTVTQDYTVSGDTIYYGDTITNNNITNNITAGGLVVGNGLGLLNAGISLIRAVLEMIKLLFVSYLIPFITLGWTGHT